MDTQKTKKVGYSKASIALIAAVSCLVIYILACVSSPVTWSPDSSKISLLVTTMEDEPDVYAIFTYDIATDEHLLLDEVKADGVLSAPSWSPDGKWIAYYKVDPSPPEEPVSPPQTDPNATASTDKSTEEAGAEIQVEKVPEQAEPKEIAEELFSEENKMLPSFLFDIVKEKMDEEDEDRETFDVKLMVVRPDGKERKVLGVMKWVGNEDMRKQLMLIRPEWSKDSKHLFYARSVDDVYYIASLNIATGQMYAHLFSSLGTSAVSPDGKWLASLIEADSDKVLLTLNRIDGSAHKYYKLDLEMDGGQGLFLTLMWAPDSKHILVSAKEDLLMVNAETDNIQKYRDPNVVMIEYTLIDNKLYYLAIRESADPNAPEETVSLKRMNLEDRKAETVFTLSPLPEISEGSDDGPARFFISPNGKMVLLRCVMEDESGNKKSALLFWDGKTQKIVETDPWLIEVLNLKNKPVGDNIPDSSALGVDG